ncbi:hypothetical protein DM870_26400, partial [Escherichia coli]
MIGTDVNTCNDTDQVTVTVNPLPVVIAGADQTICVGASVTLNGSDQTVCAGTSVTLNGSGALTYTWDNGVTDGQAFAPASTITYTVIGTDVNTCNDTDQVTVTVNPLPVVIAGADQTI